MNQTKKIPFEFSVDNLILINVLFYTQDNPDSINLTMVLDTGCTNSVLNTIEAEKLGFKKSKKNKSGKIEGAIGKPMSSYNFTPIFIEALGFSVENMVLSVLDVNISNEYSGYLGLDFFNNKKFCVDLDNQTISVE